MTIANNAKRLAFALASRAEDKEAVRELAGPLNYMEQQLALDMWDIYQYIQILERESKGDYAELIEGYAALNYEQQQQIMRTIKNISK